jgi:hypothetical protein
MTEDELLEFVANGDFAKAIADHLGLTIDALTPAVATGEYLDRWCLNNRAPADTKPNHVRDAVRANQ